MIYLRTGDCGYKGIMTWTREGLHDKITFQDNNRFVAAYKYAKLSSDLTSCICKAFEAFTEIT